MGNPNQKIIVVDRKKLFGGDYFEGFYPWSGTDYETRVLENFEVMRRGSTEEPANHPLGNAEMNIEYKQPIGYAIIANMSQGKVFAYQRASKDKDYGEKRLQGKWSWGFGGHIEPLDSHNGNPIRESVLREIMEETGLEYDERTKPAVLGYINEDVQQADDSKLGRPSIGRVHFGILYLCSANAKKLAIKDSEIARVEMKTVSELEALCHTEGVEVEGWSKIALKALRKIL